MKTILKIAWRNVWRNRKRSLILLAAISFGLWAGLFIMSFYSGIIRQRIDTAIKQEISHMQIHHPAFRDEGEIAYVIPEGEKIVDQISHIPEVSQVTGRVVIQSMLASAFGSTGAVLMGIAPGTESLTTGLESKISKGTYFHPGKSHELLISEAMAKKLRLDVGRKAVITFQHLNGELVSMAYKIIGLYKTINRPYDEKYIFVDGTSVDSLAGIKGQIHEIAVLVHDETTLDTIMNQLKPQYPGIELLRWDEISPELGLTVDVGNEMVYIFMGIILICLIFGIVNTMMMSVLERVAELGMLIAIGMTRLRIFVMILAETFFLVMAGCPPGVLLGWLSVYIAGSTGITLHFLEAVASSFGYSPVVYPFLDIRQIMIVIALVVGSALVSAIFPARRAIQCKPAESIKK
jgi:putative ABC transport system permease protein